MNGEPVSTSTREAETVFNIASSLGPVERAAYLDRVCGSDVPLRKRVEALLQAHDELGAFLPDSPKAIAAAMPLDLPISEKSGDIIGNYKLLEKLGEGGFGVVYMAEQKQPIKRRVALKIIKVGMDTREVVARFEAERQALAVLDHPNIAKVFDAGATEANISDAEGRARHSVRAEVRPLEGSAQGTDAPYQSQIENRKSEIRSGRPYFVMELVRGIKMTEYCDEKNLSTRERLDLFIQICQAVQHAHQKGIIHRDLKPSNILVTVNDGVAAPKIIDFGIAKATQMELTEKTVFTRFHQFLGTPAYMSPEQAELTNVDIDTRSDIYSLGVLLYELLTGKTPFDTNELLKAGLDEMRRTIREKEPDRPSTRVSTLRGDELTTTAKRRGLDAPKLVNVLRGDLDWIVMKCLEKDRARRYETANGLASDIQRHLKNEPVVACPPSNLYRFQKLVRRNKLAFAGGAGITAALVLGLAIALWQSIEKTRAYNRAVAAEKAAQTEAAKSRQVARYLKDVIQDLGPSVALVHEPAMVRGMLDRAAERIDRDLANQPATAIELCETLAAIYGELGLFDKMEELARKNLDLARSTFGAENLMVANALSQLGEAQFFREKLGEAETFTREALRIRRKLLGNEHLDVARSLRRMGNMLVRRTNAVEVEAVYREGLAICGRLAGEKSLVEADLLDGLAVALRQTGRRQEAEAISRQSLDIKRKILGNEHPSVVDALEVLAMVLEEEGMALKDEGKLAEAEALNRERLDICQKLFGKDHWRTGKALADMGGTLATRGRLVEAESLLRQGLAMHRKPLGKDDAGRMWRMWTLGSLEWVLRQQGKLGDAKTTLRDAIELLRNEASAGDKAAQNRLAWYLATYPDPEVRDGRTAVANAEKAVAATRRTNASYLDTLAAAYAEAGDFTNAVSIQTEAIALLETENEKKDYASRLKLYESGSPYRELE